MKNRAWHRAEVFFVRDNFTSQAHAHQCTTMPATDERDNTRATCFGTSNLNTVFNRLGACG